MDAAALALPFLFALVAVALAFDFLNGMNDAANAIATIVSTRVLRPQYAVIWAAFFNFIAFLFFGLHVAETVGRGIVAAPEVAGFHVGGTHALDDLDGFFAGLKAIYPNLQVTHDGLSGTTRVELSPAR